MQSKKSSRIEFYDTTVLLKKICSYYHEKWLDRFEQVIADKKDKTTKNDLELLAEVLAKEKSGNYEVGFSAYQKCFSDWNG